MKKFLFALLLALPMPAWATDSFGHVVTACSLQSYKVGASGPITILATGDLCTTGAGGGGGAVTIADGADVTQGAKANARSTATDTTAVTIMQVLKEISFMLQTPAALPSNQSVNLAQVNAGTVATGSGVMNSQTQRTALATDSPGIIPTGIAGTPSATVLTMQGVASMTPVLTTPTGVVTAADGSALTSTQKIFSLSGIYNGATIDMAREVSNGQNSTGTGLPSVGLSAQCDDTSPTAITENSFGHLRMGCADHALLMDKQSVYPNGAVAETATSGVVSNASTVATLAASSGKTTYITGFQCTPGSATAAALVSVVVSGTITGSMTYTAYATNATTFVPAPIPLVVPFNPPIPASTTNTTIIVTMGAVGTGGASAECNAQGFQQ